MNEFTKSLFGITYLIPERVLSFAHLGKSCRENRPVLQVNDLCWFSALMSTDLLQVPDANSSKITQDSSKQLSNFQQP